MIMSFSVSLSDLVVVHCGHPPDLENGTMVSLSENTSLGSDVVYKCNEGFLPTVEITLTCLESGNWSMDSISCSKFIHAHDHNIYMVGRSSFIMHLCSLYH